MGDKPEAGPAPLLCPLLAAADEAGADPLSPIPGVHEETGAGGELTDRLGDLVGKGIRGGQRLDDTEKADDPFAVHRNDEIPVGLADVTRELLVEDTPSPLIHMAAQLGHSGVNVVPACQPHTPRVNQGDSDWMLAHK